MAQMFPPCAVRRLGYVTGVIKMLKVTNEHVVERSLMQMFLIGQFGLGPHFLEREVKIVST